MRQRDSMRRLRIGSPHALGILVGVLVAALVLVHEEGRSSGPEAAGPPRHAVPAPHTTPDSYYERGAPTHVGSAADGGYVILWAERPQWRWEVVASPRRRCGSGDMQRAFRTTRIWAPPRESNRFALTNRFTEPVRAEGLPGSLRSRVRMAARRDAAGRVRGSFTRADVFRGNAIVPTTCEQSSRFVLHPL